MAESEQTAAERGRALVGIQTMLKNGRITQKEYDEHKAILLAGGEIELPVVSVSEPDASASEDEMSYEESVVHWLRESAIEAGKQTLVLASIRAWVTFFGVLAVISLVVWTIIFLTA